MLKVLFRKCPSSSFFLPCPSTLPRLPQIFFNLTGQEDFLFIILIYPQFKQIHCHYKESQSHLPIWQMVYQKIKQTETRFSVKYRPIWSLPMNHLPTSWHPMAVVTLRLEVKNSHDVAGTSSNILNYICVEMSLWAWAVISLQFFCSYTQKEFWKTMYSLVCLWEPFNHKFTNSRKI